MILRKLNQARPVGKSASRQSEEKYRLLAEELRQRRDNLEALVEKRMEQLLSSERHYRTLVENVPVVIARLNKEFRYIYRSPQGDNLLARNRARLAGKTWAEVGVPPDVCRLWQEKFTEALETGRAVEYETNLPNSAGETRNYFVRVIPETNEAGQIESLLSVTLDITERKRLETELQRLDRLNMVGEMAAAIGHEVRNPLTTVRGFLQMFQRKAETAGYSDHIKTMIDELDWANAIISDFLCLAKNKAVELKNRDLNDIVTALQPLLESDAHRTGHGIRVDAGELPAVKLDDRDIRQMILNLARNAFEAMETGGLLTIATRAESGKVVLTVRDNGKGIPKKLLDKLGTPFLTTKENGTGLGLAVCYRIAHRHGAKIDVKTSPQGTTFHVSFQPAGGQ